MADLLRNRWPECFGIGGRFGPEYALVKMGYGGTREDAGKAVGKTGDGGIDGIIKEDRLGLDIIYIQAKRWDGAVGRPEVQKFAGALQGHRAKKGIFITTSAFSKEAKEYVAQIDSKIVLIDGQTLANLMIEFNVGVSPIASYEIKKIDSDYFVEE
ncbi:MAG: restriction endonuclease [Firmicutes bacterium]|nr:restriction endonuclease [Bacillota bacterium]